MKQITAAIVLFAACPWIAANDVDYVRDVKPILRERCYACHGGLKQEAGLRLDTAASARRGGDAGAVIEPGSAEASYLVERISAAEEDERMPPEGRPLSAEQIAAIVRWIDAGAAAPNGEQPEDNPRDHWAFQPLVRPPVPSGAAGANPIDAFLSAEHERMGLVAAPAADRRILLRRLHLDLTGLPPTRRELHAFAADERPDALERVVDRLLADPAHGERWARHWMDVWRYADWFGLGAQLRNSQKHIWHWRDWIIESLDRDIGYDRMVTLMLAADEIAPTDKDALRATGFLARNYYLFNRTTWLDDTIEHTSKALLGLTMNCCKCHDHKYDPLAQLDYYRMRAIFEPHQVRLDAIPGETDLERDGLPRAFDAHLGAPTYLFIRGDAKQPDTSHALEPGIPGVLSFIPFDPAPVDLPPEAHFPSLAPFVLENQLRAADRRIQAAEAELAKAHAALSAAGEVEPAKPSPGDREGVDGETLGDETDPARAAVAVAEVTLETQRLRPAALRSAHAADRAKHGLSPGADVSQLVAEAAGAARRLELAEASEAAARAAQNLLRADDEKKPQAEQELKAARKRLAEAEAAVKEPGDSYTSLAATLKALEGPDETEASRRQPYPSASTGRRTALASWMTHPRNPLTARVAVNHIWMRHFGKPLVDPVTDFGRRASPPPLLPLLDWLAVEFMESGWSMKHLHRLIVTSGAYARGSSTRRASEATLAADPQNAYYWRREPLRMESQAIRDSLLHLAGELDREAGGPPLDPKNSDAVFRRSLYFRHSRDDQEAFLSMFDDADILACYRRSESIIPQQALALANSRTSLSMARRIAARLDAELGDVDDSTFACAAFETILSTPPTAAERTACLEALSAVKEELTSRGNPTPMLRARENLIHALVNHNDFISIR